MEMLHMDDSRIHLQAWKRKILNNNYGETKDRVERPNGVRKDT